MQQIFSEDATATAVEEVAKTADDGYWTTAEAANFLGKSERTIRRLLQSGVLRGYKIAGPYGMIWKVQPVENISNGGTSGAVDELIAEYQAKEEQIELLNKKVKDLEDQLARTSALHEQALHNLNEFEKKATSSSANTNQPETKTNWWNVFKFPASLKPANASELT